MRILHKIQIKKQQKVLDPFSRKFKTDEKSDKTFLKDFVSTLQKQWQELARVVNGGISFGTTIGTGSIWKCDNIDANHVSVSVGSANVNVTFSHQIGRVPTGYIVVERTAPGTPYDGSIAWTQTQMTLKFSVSGTYKLIVY